MADRDIETGFNIGPITATELRSFGVDTLERLQNLGWEDVYERWVAEYPERIHTMAAYALYGAEFEINCLSLTEEQKRRVKAVVKRLKAEYG
jgi:hypothetical protein